MIPIIYDKNEVAFTSNGLGRLYDCISCIVTEERNGVYECEFQYPISGENYSLIQVGRIIAVTHDDTEDVQPFDIIGFEKPIDGIVTFHAVHISYRLRKTVAEVAGIEGTPDAEAAFTNSEPETNFKYHFFETPQYDHVAAADGLPHTVREMLGGIEGSILDTFGGEFKWDKFDVYLMESRGVVRNITVRYGVNMIEYNDEVDSSEAYSSCIPYWTGGTTVIGDRVDSTGATPSGRIECVPLDLTEKFSSQPTKAQLEARALKYMTKNNTFLATQSITISFMPLQDYGLIEPGPPGLIYILTADANGGNIPATEGWTGTGASATKEVAAGEPYGLLPEPTQTGYNLTGWYDDPISGSPVDEFTEMGESDTTIYAHWTAESYMTTLYTDGTFIINEPASKRAANIAAHGAVTNEYDAYDGDEHNYVFTAANQRPWHNERTSITNVIIGANISPTSTAYWFYGFSNCTTIDISKIDEASVTNMLNMFQNCGSLKTIYSTSNFSNATGSGVFSNCSSLVGGFGTTYSSSRVTSAYAKIDEASEGYGYFTLKNGYMTTLYTDGMFIINEPSAQRSGNISAHGAVVNEWNPWDATLCKYIFTGTNGRPWHSSRTSVTAVKVGATIKPTILRYWFYDFQNCASFDLSNLNTADVTNMQGLFQNIKTSISLDVSTFNTANVTNMRDMFRGCTYITSITFGNSFNTASVTTMQNMFLACKGLTSLNLKSFNTGNVTDGTGMFNECENLVTIYGTSSLDLRGISGTPDVFYKCFAIVGGAGTTYSGTTKTYAHIDGGPGDPGYFTAA